MQGAALCPEPGHMCSQLLTPPKKGEGRAWACSQGLMVLPWPCQQAVALLTPALPPWG